MKDYEDENDYYLENYDEQEILYPPKNERFYEDGYCFGSDRDQEHEQRKRRAVIYIRAHFDELMKDEAYKIAYYKIVDQMARDEAYICGEPLTVVTERARELENSFLDFEITLRTKRILETYKEDAVYMVDWIKSGKSLLVYLE